MPSEARGSLDTNGSDTTNNHYVTVIQGEYSNTPCNFNSQNKDHSSEHYTVCNQEQGTKYLHSEYSEETQTSQTTTLYSVSQRVPPVQEGYATLRGTNWGPQSGSSDTAKDTSSEILSEKQTTPGSNASSTTNPNSSSSTNPGSSRATSESSGGLPQLNGVVPLCVYLMSRVAIYMDVEETSTVTVAEICSAIVANEELGLNKAVSEKIFTIWMCSPLLELQLKPTHKPFEVRKAWRALLARYSHGSPHQQQRDEPKITFQRNIFFSRQVEEKIKDQRILELLYEEAKYNILEGRYPCETNHCITLGGIQARIELGPYNPQIHSTHFFREQQKKYLPSHVRKSSNWTWLPISSKNSAEVKLLEQFKRIPASATNRKLMRKYLEFCWSLPFYGAAIFQGQVEQPVRGLMSLMTHQDIPVLVAINAQGIYVIDDIQCTMLLGLKYEELSWDYARPSREDNPDCLPCLFLQFMVLENGARVSKVLQVFSRQAVMMDTLISGFVDQIKRKTNTNNGDETDRVNNDGNTDSDETHMPLTMGGVGGRRDTPQSSLSNKLSRLTLSTFDDEGRCIGQMGSWSFSY